MQIPSLRPLAVRKNASNGFTIASVHYSCDPDKLNEQWLNEARRGLSERAWNREYEIDYTSFAGKPFFPEFNAHNIAPVDLFYTPGDILYRGWDFGFHRPCCVITMLNQYDQWVILKVILGQDESIMTFGKRVRNLCLSNFPGAKYIDACDIAGMQVTDKSESTSVQILNSLGIYPQARKQPTKQGSEIVRQKLLVRIDGKPGMLVNPSQQYVIDAFRGGLHYPDTEGREGKEKEHYEKDGYFDHFGDSLRYIATEMFTVIGQMQNVNTITLNPEQEKYAMGSIHTSSDYWSDEVEQVSDGGISDYF